MIILEIHQALHDHSKRTVQFLGYDLLRGALSIANVVSVQTTPHVVSLASIGFTYAPLVQKAIDMLTDKAARLGYEQRQFWVALAAHGFIKSRKDVSQRPLYTREAVNIITDVYHKMMECQEDGIPSVSGTDYLPAVPGEPAVTLAEATDPTLFNFDDFAAWTFEDWMLDPGDPLVGFNAT